MERAVLPLLVGPRITSSKGSATKSATSPEETGHASKSGRFRPPAEPAPRSAGRTPGACAVPDRPASMALAGVQVVEEAETQLQEWPLELLGKRRVGRGARHSTPRRPVQRNIP